MRNTIFISDLHLSSNRPETTQLFEKFANELTDETDTLYIIGDIFQFWAGDDDRSEFNEKIKNIFKNISTKIPIYFMPGNRDFLLGEIFAKESSSTLLNDPCAVSLYGQTVVLTHGDILCTKDFKYSTFRSIIRFPFGLKIFLMMPLSFRLWLARKIQKLSVKHNNSSIPSLSSSTPSLSSSAPSLSSSAPSLSSSAPSLSSSGLTRGSAEPKKQQLDPRVKPEDDKESSKHLPQQDEIEKILKKYNSKLMIHGHMHKVEIDEFLLDNGKAKRICLDEWTNKTKIFVYYNDHSFDFKETN